MNNNDKINIDDNYLSSLIYSELDRILQENNLDDFKELSQNEFTGYLLKLGKFIKSGNYIYNNYFDNVSNKIIKSYNFDNINIIYNIYIELCLLNNKVVNIIGLISILGVSYETLDDWVNESSQGNTDFIKRFRRDYEQSHESKLNDKGVNAVGVIAILNHRFGWSDNGGNNNKIVVNVNGGGLPDLSGSSEKIPTTDTIQGIETALNE